MSDPRRDPLFSWEALEEFRSARESSEHGVQFSDELGCEQCAVSTCDLPKDLQDAWSETVRTGEPVDIGRTVVCDHCNADYTDSTDCGGVVLGSNGYCPKCAPRLVADAEKYGEAQYIRARCPEGKSFGDFIREYRSGNNTIRVRSFK